MVPSTRNRRSRQVYTQKSRKRKRILRHIISALLAHEGAQTTILGEEVPTAFRHSGNHRRGNELSNSFRKPTTFRRKRSLKSAGLRALGVVSHLTRPTGNKVSATRDPSACEEEGSLHLGPHPVSLPVQYRTLSHDSGHNGPQ